MVDLVLELGLLIGENVRSLAKVVHKRELHLTAYR